MLLDTLKFVQGSVAKKDFVASLTHFKIENGRIYGYNGRISICAPIPLDLNVSPKAIPFIRAIETCREEVAMSLTPAGRLSVKSGKFKAFIDCLPESFTPVQPRGQFIHLAGGMLDTFKALLRFTGEDASRPWAMGILFRGQSAFATNNICLVEYWIGYPFPCEINIPKATIQELLRIGREPEWLQMDQNSVTFWFDKDHWMHSVLYDTQWPDLGKILNRACNLRPIPAGFFDAVNDVEPFIGEDTGLYITPGNISTNREEGLGAAVEVPGLEATGKYAISQLKLLENVVDQIDFSAYPLPCIFYGQKMRGAIIGMRS